MSAGTRNVRTTNVSTRTDTTKKNESWFRAGIDENKSPMKAIAMIIPAAVMMLPVLAKPDKMEAFSPKPCSRASRIAVKRNMS